MQNTLRMRLAKGQEQIYLNTSYPKIGVVSGVGFGKTHLAVRKHHRLCTINKRSRQSLCGAPTHDLLKNNLIPLYLEHLDELGYRQGKHYRITYGSSPVLEYSFGHSVLFRPLGPQSTKRMVAFTLSHATVDEAGQCAETTPVEVTKRLRCPRAAVIQQIYYGTPEGVGNFFFKHFGGQAVTRLTNSQFSVGNDGRCVVLHGRTEDNPVMTEDYLTSLRAELSWNPNLIRAYMYGEFVPIYNNSCYDFDPEKHKQDGPTWADRPIYQSWDFNVTQGRAGGVSWVGIQENHSDLHVVAENRGSSRTTFEAVDNFVTQFPVEKFRYSEIVVTGDSSGHSRDTRSYGTDYDIIRQKLAEAGYQNVRIQAPHANPSVGLRIASVNRLFSPDWPQSLLVRPKCTKTIDSLIQTTINDTGKIKKPAGETHTHYAEAAGYGVTLLRPIKKPHVSGSVDFAWA